MPQMSFGQAYDFFDNDVTSQNLAVAAAGTVTVFTVTAGQSWIFNLFTIGVTVAGLFTIAFVNTLATFILPASQTQYIYIGPYVFTAGFACTIKNNTASASDIRFFGTYLVRNETT